MRQPHPAPRSHPVGAPAHPARRTVAEHRRQVGALVTAALAARAPLRLAVTDLLADARAGVFAPRRLAADARAVVALPGFDNSQMDGYAVRSADLARAGQDAVVSLPVGPAVPAGQSPAPLPPGTAVPVMTGAPIPPGADAVVRVEDADPPSFGGGPGGGVRVEQVTFAAPVAPGTFVRVTGSDVAADDVVVRAGTALGPAQVGALVAAGVRYVDVVAPPRVLLVSTGSEVVAPGSPLGPAQVYDANGSILTAALAQVGCRVDAHVLPDDAGALRAVLAAAHDVDLVITTGGVSQGAFEVVRAGFSTDTGGPHPDAVWFGGVAVQPGGPQGLGTIAIGTATPGGARQVPLVAFPGNPVSALISFELFVRPLLAAATAVIPAERLIRRAPLAAPLDSPPAVLQVRRGAYDAEGRVHLVGGSGSHLLAHLAAATVLVHIPPGVDHLEAGDVVETWEIA